MTKENWTRQEPEELASVESFLDKYGELWAEAAVRDSADLTAQFQKRLRRQSVTEKTPSIGLGWFLRPAWMMAAAACVLALFLLPQYWDQSVGRIVYFGGEVRLNEMTPSSDFLNSGNEVKVAEE